MVSTAGQSGVSGQGVPGFNYKHYEGEFDADTNLAQLTPVVDAHSNHISRSLGEDSKDIGLNFSGQLNIDQAGDYTFAVFAMSRAIL
ncbi:MAG: hypothetical protein GY917_23270, partial [Planctomycetaceae bacterium]|nr:hypothetical protein [Planctomycetaceae bacterium]